MTRPPALPEIELTAATYLGLALDALQTGNLCRAIECLASIDARSWSAITNRFPGLPGIMAKGGVSGVDAAL